MYTIGSIEYKRSGIILPFEFHTGVDPEGHTGNYQRYWLQLAESKATCTAIVQRDTQVDYTPLILTPPLSLSVH